MPMYIVLGKFTEQGVRDLRSLRQRVQENQGRAEKLGLKNHGWYLTMGQYDYVVVGEAPDDQTMAAMILGVSSGGGAHTETLRAFTLDEAEQIVQKLG